MKRNSVLVKLIALKGLALSAVLMSMGGQAQAQLIDDYSGDLSAYTGTVILDAGGTGSNTSAWEISSGQLSLNTTDYDGIEQHAYIYDGVSLGIGQELQADFSNIPLLSQRNFGLYVGGTAPATGVREDYITVYADQANTTIRSRGFDGTTEYNNPGAGPAADGSTLFIARTGANEFETGFYDGATRTVVTTRTPAAANSADFVGYYADVREAGVIGFADNLRIVVPEPSAIALIALGTASLLSVRKRRAR